MTTLDKETNKNLIYLKTLKELGRPHTTQLETYRNLPKAKVSPGNQCYVTGAHFPETPTDTLCVETVH